MHKLWESLCQFHEFIIGHWEHVEVQPRVEHSFLLLRGDGERVQVVSSLIDPFIHNLHKDDLTTPLAVLFCCLLSLCLQLTNHMLQILPFNSFLRWGRIVEVVTFQLSSLYSPSTGRSLLPRPGYFWWWLKEGDRKTKSQKRGEIRAIFSPNIYSYMLYHQGTKAVGSYFTVRLLHSYCLLHCSRYTDLESLKIRAHVILLGGANILTTPTSYTSMTACMQRALNFFLLGSGHPHTDSLCTVLIFPTSELRKGEEQCR